MSDLFSNEEQTNAIAEKKFQDLLKDPRRGIELYEARNKELEKKVSYLETEVVPKAQKWSDLIDSQGLVSCKKAAEALGIKYFPNGKGKSKLMERNVFIAFLLREGIIYRTSAGLAIKSQYFQRGYGKTVTAEKNEDKDVVKFTYEGLGWLYDKYKNDKRIWRTNNGRVEEMGVELQSISGEGQNELL